jgi:hypothetical protein
MYHQKYDQVLHDMEELRQKHEYEISVLFSEIDQATQDAQSERAIRQIHVEQIELLERQIAQQVNYSAVSQATTVPRGSEDRDQDRDLDREIMSPVSVASPSPRMREGLQSPRLDPETPNSCCHDPDDKFHQYHYGYSSQSSRTTDCSGDPICHSDSD